MGTETARLDYVVTGQAKLAALEKQLERIQLLTRGIGTEGLSGTIAPDIGKNLKTLPSDISAVTGAFGGMKLAAIEGAAAINMVGSAAGGRTGSAWSGEIARINALKNGIANIGTTSSKAAREIHSSRAAFSELGKSIPVGQVQQFTEAFRHGIATAGTFTSKLAILMIAFAIFRTVQTIIRGVIQGFKDLDDATRKVMSASAVAGEANVSYAGTFLTVAYNAVKYRTAVKDVGDATWELTSAGLSASEALAGTGTVLKLLTADVTDVGTSTRLVAGIYRTFKDELGETATEAEKFARIGDVLAYALNRSQVNMEGLIDGLKHSLGVSASAGIQFEVLVASLAILNDHMMMGAIAGTGMRAAMIQLSQDIEFLADKYDLVVDKSKSWGEQLMPVLAQLHEKIDSGNLSITDMGDLLKSTGARGGQAILVLTQYYEEFDALIKALEKDATGALEAMSSVRMESLTRNWEGAKTAAKSFGATLAGPMMSGINTFLSGANDVSAEILRIGALLAKKYEFKIVFSKDEMENLKWWQRGIYDLGRIVAGTLMPGTGLWTAGWGDLFAWVSTELEKIGKEAGETGKEFDKLYESMNEVGRTDLIEMMIGPVEMLSVKIAEGTVTVDDYRSALDYLTSTLDDNVYEYVRLRAEIEKANKEGSKSSEELDAMKARWDELGKTIASGRKEIAGTTKEMNKLSDTFAEITDRKMWALDTLFGFDEISSQEYIAKLAEMANEAMLNATLISASRPGSSEEAEAQRRAADLMSKYADETDRAAKSMEDLNDAKLNYLQAGLEGLGMGDDASISSIKDRIFYFEQFKKSLSDPREIIEVDKAIASLYKEIEGKGVNVSYEAVKVFEDIIAKSRELPEPIDDTKNRFDGLDAAIKAGFLTSLTNAKDGIIPEIATKVVDLSAGFGVACESVGMLNAALDTTIGKLRIAVEVAQTIGGVSKNNVITYGQGAGGESLNRSLKAGD